MKYRLNIILCNLLLSVQAQAMFRGPSQLQKIVGTKISSMVKRAASSEVDDAIRLSREKVAANLKQVAEEMVQEFELRSKAKKEEEKKKRREHRDDFIDDVILYNNVQNINDAAFHLSLQQRISQGKEVQAPSGSSIVESMTDSVDSSIIDSAFQVAGSVAQTVGDVVSAIGDSVND